MDGEDFAVEDDALIRQPLVGLACRVGGSPEEEGDSPLCLLGWIWPETTVGDGDGGAREEFGDRETARWAASNSGEDDSAKSQ